MLCACERSLKNVCVLKSFLLYTKKIILMPQGDQNSPKFESRHLKQPKLYDDSGCNRSIECIKF